MKFKHDSRMTTIAVYAFLVLAAAIVFNMLIGSIGQLFTWLGNMVGYVLPVVYGFIFAFLLNPMVRFFENLLFVRAFKKNKLKPTARRGIAIGISYLVTLIMIFLFLLIVILQLIPSMVEISNDIPSYLKYIKSLQNFYEDITQNLREWQLIEDEMASDIIQTFAGQMLGAIEGGIEWIGDYVTVFIGKIITWTANFTSGLIEVVLGVIVSIYFLADKERLLAQAKKITTAVFKPDTCNLLYDIAMDTNKIFSGFVTGKIIDSVIIGILCFIGLSILGFSNTALISVIIGVTNVIPYFGPFIGAIPGFFLVIITDGPAKSLVFLIFVLLLQQFDGNILGPKILGDSTGLSALWVIFSILLFSGMLGILGMFIGVPLFALIYSLVKRFVAHLLRRKGESTDTRSYASDKNPLIK